MLGPLPKPLSGSVSMPESFAPTLAAAQARIAGVRPAAYARMWLASDVVHVRKVHWRTGAGSSKPYLFNADNVARYAPASCHRRGGMIDTTVVIGVFLAGFHQAWPWSERRWRFGGSRVTELAVQRWFGDDDARDAALAAGAAALGVPAGPARRAPLISPTSPSEHTP